MKRSLLVIGLFFLCACIDQSPDYGTQEMPDGTVLEGEIQFVGDVFLADFECENGEILTVRFDYAQGRTNLFIGKTSHEVEEISLREHYRSSRFDLYFEGRNARLIDNKSLTRTCSNVRRVNPLKN